MGRYILRRLGQAAFTIFGVMLITFLLFRVMAGDIAWVQLGEKSTERERAAWRHRFGYDRPLVVNMHNRLLIIDHTKGSVPTQVEDPAGSNVAEALGLALAAKIDFAELGINADSNQEVLIGRYVFRLSGDTPLEKLTNNLPLADSNAYKAAMAALAAPESVPATAPAATVAAAPGSASAPAGAMVPAASSPASAPAAAVADAGEATGDAPEAAPVNYPVLRLILSNKKVFQVNLTGANTCGQMMDLINKDPNNRGQVEARISDWRPVQVFQSQFFHHLLDSVTFQARSLSGEKKMLTEIISERAPASLAVQVPAFAMEWIIGMTIACFVAYFRGSLWDRIGVFLSVLGMCIPFLAFMIYGQAFMFRFFPAHAYGVEHRVNLYVPIIIIVISGVGGQVRFYRTIILDETNRDYVRTARAKGVALPTILFKHVLRNCMLPILTSLILTIPFLFMGGLLTESYFGIPGLGDLMIGSIQERNEPVLNGMVFLTALIYTVGTLLTDISYGLFDPRIRLR